jgi:hypothetical protein
MRIKYTGIVASNYKLLSSLHVVIQNSSSFKDTVFRALPIIYFELHTLFLFPADKSRGSYSAGSKISS